MDVAQAGAVARTTPSASVHGAGGLTLAGLIDVLDRADTVPLRGRPRPQRAAVHLAGSSRVVADRWDPLRTTAGPVRPGAPSRRRPPARPVPVRALTVRAAPAIAPPQPAAPAAPPPVVVAPVAVTPVEVPGRPAWHRPGAWVLARLAAAVRRAALWGAGPDGENLAWGARPVRTFTAALPRPDAPVVLEELPSTPTSARAPLPPDPPVPAPTPTASLGVRPVGVVRGVAGTRRPLPRRPVAAGVSARIHARVPAAAAVGLSAREHGPARARAPDAGGGIRGSPAPPQARGSPARQPSDRSPRATSGTQPQDAVPAPPRSAPSAPVPAASLLGWP